MKWRRVWAWGGTAVLLAGGVGFLVIAGVTSSAASTYRAAQPCGQAGAAAANCYRLSPGVITSVHVRDTRAGEHDDVTIQTDAGSSPAVTLTPSSWEAPHVRTGARVAVKIYKDEVTAVVVDETSVPSLDNPAANESNYLFYGIFSMILGAASGGLMLFTTRRRTTAERLVDVRAQAPLQPGVVPGGNVGVVLAPRFQVRLLWRYAAGIGLLLVLSARWLFIPDKMLLVAGLDGLLFAGLALVVLSYRHIRVFVDAEGIGRVNLFGVMRRYPPGSLTRAVRYTVASQGWLSPSLSFIGPDGRQAFRVGDLSWDTARLDALCARAGLPVEGSWDDVVSVYQMNRRAPGSVRWGRNVVIVVVGIVVIVAFITAMAGPETR